MNIKNLKNGEIKYKVFSHYSQDNKPECKWCGYNNIKALCLDHVNGDGNIHRKEKKNRKGINLYKYLLRSNFDCKYELQVLCANCNLIKSIDNKESSHIKDDKWKRKISKSNSKVTKKKGKDSSRAREVYQYDLNGNFLKKWDYIKEAESYYNNNKNAKNIVACCNNRQKTAYGYIWKHFKI